MDLSGIRTGWYHGLALAIINIASIVAGSAIHRVIGGRDQASTQGVAAAIITIVAFNLWIRLLPRLSSRATRPLEAREFVWAYAFALAWGAGVFLPLHYFTQGYLTSFGNISALWGFQVPVNLLAMLIAYRLDNP
ncbi:MAG: hypothetical protein ABIJ00_09685 [Candidatus Eisenbacteria bacterium]